MLDDITCYSEQQKHEQGINLLEAWPKLTYDEEDNHKGQHNWIGLVEGVLFYPPPEQGQGY